MNILFEKKELKFHSFFIFIEQIIRKRYHFMVRFKHKEGNQLDRLFLTMSVKTINVVKATSFTKVFQEQSNSCFKLYPSV